MRSALKLPSLKLLPHLSLVLLVVALPAALSGADEPKPPSLPPGVTKAQPETIEDLKAIQDQVKKVLEKVQPATVGVRIGQSSGSGVIVSKDGYVLTAGHVSGAPGKECTLILPNGKTVKAKSLGNNRAIDSGMFKITEEGEWPFVEMGSSADLQKGQWCIASGHPTGFKPGRSPVVRLGRVLGSSKSVIQTDCTLVGGDSGGPLFDMNGKVIGIHSRIGGSIAANMHVPVDTYHDTWDQLVKGEVIGTPAGPYLGVELDPESTDCKVARVLPDTAADKAGLKTDDIILKFNGQKVSNSNDLRVLVERRKVGDTFALEVRRGEETLTLKATLGKR